MVQIVVMARWPSPGRCKRRLSRDLKKELGLSNSSERATRIQRRLTQHTAAVVRGLADAMEIEPVLAVSGLGPRAADRWGKQLGLRQVRLQKGATRHPIATAIDARPSPSQALPRDRHGSALSQSR